MKIPFFPLSGYLLSCFLLILPATAIGRQDCDCAGYEKPGPLPDGGSNTFAIQTLLNSTVPACRAKGFESMADAALANKLFDSCEVYLNKAAALYRQNECGEASRINYYKLWSTLYYNRSDYSASLNYLLKVLPVAESTKNHYETAHCLLKIAQVFNRMGQAEKGIGYCRNAVPFINKLENPFEKAGLLHLASSRYLFYYQDYKDMSSLDTCRILAMRSLEYSKQSDNKEAMIKAYSLVQTIAFYKKDYTKALQYIDSSLMYCEPGVDDNMLGSNFADKADILMEMQQFAAARKYADTALYYRKLFKRPELIANAYSLIYEIANRSGNYKDALWAVEKYQEITDSLKNADKIKAVNELEKKYNQAKNEKTINELAQQKRIYLLLIVIACLAILVTGFYLRQQSLKHKQRILEAEQRLNRARMNPHFFFNALASLQSFALTENNGKAIALNLSRFARIMRESLESTYKEYITIEQEMDFQHEYLELQKMRYPKKFSYEIKADSDLETDELMIPSMILQPFAENAIEHGFAGIDYEGHIAIRFSREEKEVLIEIEDNGKGLNRAGKGTDEHISRAGQIIKDRLYLLNSKMKTQARYSINNNKTGKGVIVEIHLPVFYKEDLST